MPHLNGAGESQRALHDRYKTIAENRDEQQLSPIEKVCESPGKQAEREDRNPLSEPRETQLKRGAGKLINLIQVLRLAHLLRRGREQGQKKNQAKTGIIERCPRSAQRRAVGVVRLIIVHL